MLLASGTAQPAVKPATQLHLAAYAASTQVDDRAEMTALRRAAAARADRSTRPEQTAAPVAPPAPVAQPRRPRPPAPARSSSHHAAQQVTPTGGSRAGLVVAFVLAQVGKPYVGNAAGPGAFDCSGLALAAYARVGIRLPHSSDGQMGYGQRVGRGELAAGDLVFWPGHVAVYVGGGRIVAAARPGEGVVLQSIWGAPIGYRRLL